ncbi:high osmolarity signaling protein SHO1 [Eremomyces bilateralis CBS 781.70]|uniref:High osmolarity signaling protein SHO1 n=1 Tax=Eremomyces bilateralis CBS 781.70 TaxID=1392243 RepID=A0A6G1GDY8_9PEZI|nr:high osmolarity signaling protein SHO1 [Eremomyces bilateralis CBS 781.70]KAF1816110.1 high osmolarity signaling protein SHO1 [Eremomyces bilateralis CBS 781.70]
MPPYGALQSPSLRKMERGYGDHSPRGRGFRIGYIVGDPFALYTISISVLAWIISLIGSIVAVADRSKADHEIPNYTWWSLSFNLVLIIGITIMVGTETEMDYSVAVVGFLGAALVFDTSSISSLVYSSNGAKAASAAGFMVLSMVAVIWMFYFGSHPSASLHAWVDSHALHKTPVDRPSMRTSRGMSTGYKTRPETSITAQPPLPQMYTSAQLNGFETSSPVSGYAGGPVGANSDNRNSTAARFGGASGLGGGVNGTMTGPDGNEVTAPTEYPYRAKAIYSYEANPDDANEISFSKNDILEVSDVSGRWWQAKKETGETGIAPSNYLILL